jgi:hypothetical protein
MAAQHRFKKDDKQISCERQKPGFWASFERILATFSGPLGKWLYDMDEYSRRQERKSRR